MALSATESVLYQWHCCIGESRQLSKTRPITLYSLHHRLWRLKDVYKWQLQIEAERKLSVPEWPFWYAADPIEWEVGSDISRIEPLVGSQRTWYKSIEYRTTARYNMAKATDRAAFLSRSTIISVSINIEYVCENAQSGKSCKKCINIQVQMRITSRVIATMAHTSIALIQVMRDLHDCNFSQIRIDIPNCKSQSDKRTIPMHHCYIARVIWIVFVSFDLER